MSSKRPNSNNIETQLKRVQLRQSQKKYLEQIENNEITFCYGPAGTSKTFTACYAALKLLKENKIKQIILCKPIQEAGEKLGFLPGSKEDKVDPYMKSYKSNIEKIIGQEETKLLFDKKIIKFEPLAYMRGDTFDECLVSGEVVYLSDGTTMKIDELYSDLLEGNYHDVLSYSTKTNTIEPNTMTGIIKAPIEKYIEIILEDDTVTKVSLTHKFYTTNGIKLAKDLTKDDEIISL